MTRVCGWCRQVLGDNGDGRPGVTHGICPPCQAAHLEPQIQRLRAERAARERSENHADL